MFHSDRYSDNVRSCGRSFTGRDRPYHSPEMKLLSVAIVLLGREWGGGKGRASSYQMGQGGLHPLPVVARFLWPAIINSKKPVF